MTSSDTWHQTAIIPFRITCPAKTSRFELQLPSEAIGHPNTKSVYFSNTHVSYNELLPLMPSDSPSHDQADKEQEEVTTSPSNLTTNLESNFRLKGEITNDTIIHSTEIARSPLRKIVDTFNDIVGQFCLNYPLTPNTIAFLDYIPKDDLFIETDSFTKKDFETFMFDSFDYYYLAIPNQTQEEQMLRMRRQIKNRQKYVDNVLPNLTLPHVPRAVDGEELLFRLHLRRGCTIAGSSTLFKRLGFKNPEIFGTRRGETIKISHRPEGSDKEYVTILADGPPQNLHAPLAQSYRFDLGFCARKIDISTSFEISLAALYDQKILYESLQRDVFAPLSKRWT